MKKSVEKGSTREHPGSLEKKGDWVRIKKPDHDFLEYQQARDTRRTSLELTNGGKYPRQTSTRVRKHKGSNDKPHEGLLGGNIVEQYL